MHAGGSKFSDMVMRYIDHMGCSEIRNGEAVFDGNGEGGQISLILIGSGEPLMFRKDGTALIFGLRFSPVGL
jgi:hypothetical protein